MTAAIGYPIIDDTVGAGSVGEELLRTIQDHKLCHKFCWLCLDLDREPPEKEIVYEEDRDCTCAAERKLGTKETDTRREDFMSCDEDARSRVRRS